MNMKGLTLIELLIVIVVIGIIAGFAIPTYTGIVSRAQEAADDYNLEYLGDTIETAYYDGTLIIKNNRLYNTKSERSYSGTGSWFVEDMKEYLGSRLVPQIQEAQNPYNKDSGDGFYKFWFDIEDDHVNIFYYDTNKDKVVVATAKIF